MAGRKVVRFIKENNLSIKLKLYFIAKVKGDGSIISMHGLDEVEENIHQLLIKKYWPDKLYDYFILTEKISHFEALKKVGISYQRIDKLRNEGKDLLKDNLKVAEGLNVKASPAFIWENKYVFSGLDNIMGILEKEKEEVYKKAHPIIEYLIFTLGEYDGSESLLDLLRKNFRIKGTSIPYPAIPEEYISKFKIKCLPFVFIYKKNLSYNLINLVKERTNWVEAEEGFVVPKEEVLKVSPVYFLDRQEKLNQIDIIVNREDINRFKESVFIGILEDSGFKVNFHVKGLFKYPRLYKELKMDYLPLILWKNQYLVTDFKQLFSLIELRE